MEARAEVKTAMPSLIRAVERLKHITRPSIPPYPFTSNDDGSDDNSSSDDDSVDGHDIKDWPWFFYEYTGILYRSRAHKVTFEIPTRQHTHHTAVTACRRSLTPAPRPYVSSTFARSPSPSWPCVPSGPTEAFPAYDEDSHYEADDDERENRFERGPRRRMLDDFMASPQRDIRRPMKQSQN